MSFKVNNPLKKLFGSSSSLNNSNNAAAAANSAPLPAKLSAQQPQQQPQKHQQPQTQQGTFSSPITNFSSTTTANYNGGTTEGTSSPSPLLPAGTETLLSAGPAAAASSSTTNAAAAAGSIKFSGEDEGFNSGQHFQNRNTFILQQRTSSLTQPSSASPSPATSSTSPFHSSTTPPTVFLNTPNGGGPSSSSSSRHYQNQEYQSLNQNYEQYQLQQPQQQEQQLAFQREQQLIQEREFQLHQGNPPSFVSMNQSGYGFGTSSVPAYTSIINGGEPYVDGNGKVGIYQPLMGDGAFNHGESSTGGVERQMNEMQVDGDADHDMEAAPPTYQNGSASNAGTIQQHKRPQHKDKAMMQGVIKGLGTKKKFILRGGLPIDAVLTSCCAMYRLWLKKAVGSESGPIFTFPFVSIPENFKQRPDFIQYIKSPYGTEDWFPTFCQFMHELVKKSKVSMPVVMVALLYVGRLRNSVTLDTVVNPVNPLIQSMQIFLVALIVSQKIHSDIRYTNLEWAKISGYSLAEINESERIFLKYYLDLNSKFAVAPHQYHQWHGICHSLQAEYEFTFRSYRLSVEELIPYLQKARRYRPELVLEIMAGRGLDLSLLPALPSSSSSKK